MNTYLNNLMFNILFVLKYVQAMQSYVIFHFFLQTANTLCVRNMLHLYTFNK